MLLTRDTLPETIPDITALDDLLCRPSQALIDDLNKVDGDIMILGVAGKMGPTLAGLAKAALPGRRVIGVARFSESGSKEWLQGRGVETIACDLLDEAAIKALPKVQNIVFMAGRKFGAEGDLSLTWAMNAHVPALVAQAFCHSRIVAFSTGCVYPVRARRRQGIGREHAAQPARRICAVLRRPRAHVRIFLAQIFDAGPAVPAELRHRHALRRAARHRDQGPAGQTDRRQPRPCQFHLAGRCIFAGAALPRALRHADFADQCQRPRNSRRARSRREKLGARLGREPVIVGQEEPTAWLTDTSQATKLFGLPIVDTGQLIEWTADWVARAMPSLGKPTKYEVRDGRY